MNPSIRPAAAAVLALALSGLAACATPSDPTRMSVPATPGLTASAGDVGYHAVRTVTVSGGSDTNPLWTSQVSDQAFKSALETSLTAAGYVGSEGEPMTVNASLLDLKQPMIGLDMTVTSQVRYSVTQGNRTVFDETVSAAGTATVSEAFVAVERLRLANEKSILENIKSFLTRFGERAR